MKDPVREQVIKLLMGGQAHVTLDDVVKTSCLSPWTIDASAKTACAIP
jgi:hypothetical protein